jgi:hypothetical protein
MVRYISCHDRYMSCQPLTCLQKKIMTYKKPDTCRDMTDTYRVNGSHVCKNTSRHTKDQLRIVSDRLMSSHVNTYNVCGLFLFILVRHVTCFLTRKLKKMWTRVDLQRLFFTVLPILSSFLSFCGLPLGVLPLGGLRLGLFPLGFVCGSALFSTSLFFSSIFFSWCLASRCHSFLVSCLLVSCLLVSSLLVSFLGLPS